MASPLVQCELELIKATKRKSLTGTEHDVIAVGAIDPEVRFGVAQLGCPAIANQTGEDQGFLTGERGTSGPQGDASGLARHPVVRTWGNDEEK